MTLGDKLSAENGRPAGFDYLRLCLALGVLIWHSFSVSYGIPWINEATSGLGRAPVALLVPMFFSVSGFLVAASLQRNPVITNYLSLRGLRILPGLTVEVALSALVLGSISTTLPLSDYFSSPGVAIYFLNIVGLVHFRLPGVFEGNPFPGVVNGQIWSVPFELCSYALLGLLGAIGVVRNRWLFLVAVLVGEAVALSIHLISPNWLDGGIFGSVRGFRVAHIFFAAAVLYVFRDRVPMSAPMFVASAITTVVLLVNWRPIGDYLISFPLAYATTYLGLLNPHRNAAITNGDFSYGIYLYGMPIQQWIASWGAWTHHWWVNLCFALPFTLCVAIASWFLIERPALGLRSAFVRRVPNTEAGAQGAAIKT